eukprot:TRINITY_DN4174_c0_g1_i1.p1 TRINITY_DN4174_c0_g1~~TRINITY_DN4174_c0_g1_i1.p1  ORF type:complete len:315 (+),score=37.65 TRINITY_DN4174_c0_g1_i1:153-1097(+)
MVQLNVKFFIGIIFTTLILLLLAIIYSVELIVLLVLRLLPSDIYWKCVKYVYTQYHWVWLLQNWGRVKMIYSGETNTPKGEPALMIVNHQDDLDFGAGPIVYMHHGIKSAETKWVSKASVRLIPLFGWVHYLTGDLFLHRSWEADAENIKHWLSKFRQRHFKRMVIFPEGTRSRSSKKMSESQEFARKNGLPVLNHVLYPRTKGFALMAKYLRDNPGTIDYVYDVTFGYYPGGVGLFTFLQGPIYTNIHVFVARHKLTDIGETEADFASWCTRRFQLKDKLMQHFEKFHEFPSLEEANKMEKDLFGNQKGHIRL